MADPHILEPTPDILEPTTPPDPAPEPPPVEEPMPEPPPIGMGPGTRGLPPELVGPDGHIHRGALVNIVPSACAWSTQRAQDGSMLAIQRIESINGTWFFGFPMDMIRQMGEDLVAFADANPVTHLFIPGTAVPPDLRGERMGQG